MIITLDRHTRQETCHTCDTQFCFVCGTVFDEGHPVGLYLLALHGHSEEGLYAHAAITVVAPQHDEPQAASIHITLTGKAYEYRFSDWAESPWGRYPWEELEYFGRRLDRQEARESDCRWTFLHIAEHITNDLPEVKQYERGGG